MEDDDCRGNETWMMMKLGWHHFGNETWMMMKLGCHHFGNETWMMMKLGCHHFGNETWIEDNNCHSTTVVGLQS